MTTSLSRRNVLTTAARRSVALAGALAWPSVSHAAATATRQLLVGSARADTTPPHGIELAGFHRSPKKPRRIAGSRQASTAHAIAISHGDSHVLMVSLDILAVSSAFTAGIRAAVSERLGIPGDVVRICATHTHSMPTCAFMRQWGAIDPGYRDRLAATILRVVEAAWNDRRPAELSVGTARTLGGNFNRTVPVGEARTDADFDDASTPDVRWLDTALHVLRFDRTGGGTPVVWYQYSSHPVCYHDALSGPDWPGLVADDCLARHGVRPVFLQGHAGDVNPGDGAKWIGDAEPAARAVSAALTAALAGAKPVAIDRIASVRERIDLPIDLDLHDQWLDEYRGNSDACVQGPWVDPAFASDWFLSAQRWDRSRETYATTISTIRLGPIAMFFHPAELYSFYGFALQRGSPFEETICVGYTDDFAGYLVDPRAYEKQEYAAVVVPKILDIPPFTTKAAARLTSEGLAMLRTLDGGAGE